MGVKRQLLVEDYSIRDTKTPFTNNVLLIGLRRLGCSYAKYPLIQSTFLYLDHKSELNISLIYIYYVVYVVFNGLF